MDMSIPTTWVGTANEPASGFPLQSLPYCAFTPASTPEAASAPEATPHLGVGIGAFILDLHQLQSNNLLTTLSTDLQSACTAPQLNPLMRCGPAAWSALRQRLFDLLKTIEPRSNRNTDQQRLVASLMLPRSRAVFHKPVAAYIGTGNPQGTPIPIAEAERHLFGLSLLNDWSARDIQSWEAQPLGPFLGKNFATSLSPWVVPMEALAPYRTSLAPRPSTNPQPLPHLTEPSSAPPSGIDITLEVLLSTAHMREASLPPFSLSKSNLRDLYWSFPQMLAHHTSNGCNLLPGDILASGTVSGPSPSSVGSLLEITQRGTAPIHLPNGELRTFLEDGDEIILRGHCHREGLPTLTLGDCRGTILSASS